MNRSVFRLTGADRIKFLQNLVTNDVLHLDRAPAYAALLTPQGKFLADFFLVAEGDSILLDVASELADDLIRRLTMYRLRADVQIVPTDLQVSRGLGEPPANAFPDPRHPALGWRLIGPQVLQDPTDWDAIRVEHLIPEAGVELLPGDSYVLECGLDRLHGVDFRKGCYVGQEVTARMKHKTELKKGLVRIGVAQPVPPGTPILTADGRSVGQTGTWSGGRALAYLRFDFARDALSVGGERITVEAA